MKKISTVIWGIIFVAAGVIIALNALEVTNINIFFRGWWTLFIIIPCAAGLLTGRDKTGNLIGLLIGVALLLSVHGVIKFNLLFKLAFPAIIIIIGIKMIGNSLFDNKHIEEINSKMKESGNELKSGTATFSSQNLSFDGELFEGAELNAVFGGVKCDIRNARIEKDCVIYASAIFGGIEIIAPENAIVKVNSNSIFGGVSNKRQGSGKDNAHTIYVKATCMFGGVEIK